MAIAHISASWQWFRATAKRVPDYPRLKRELLAAGMAKVKDREIRRSLTAELMSDEVRVLAERLPNDERIAAALERIEASEVRDRERAERVWSMMDRYRGAPPE